jgi:hypothetical protein
MSHEVKCFLRESCGIHIVHEEAGGLKPAYRPAADSHGVKAVRPGLKPDAFCVEPGGFCPATYAVSLPKTPSGPSNRFPKLM